MCRRFVLDRAEDPSGVSGCGTVALGIVFDDGTVALHWNGRAASTGVYGSIDDVKTIHGHDGSTQVRWIDEECEAS